ncbi:MAG: heparinase II/III family protein [Candidatus Marinimicrobia bacterium]|nr:heparinase II/III family protein [Candidatus Neomarinimicrobiota bacterium]
MKKSLILCRFILLISGAIHASPWHPDINHRPRVLLTGVDLNAVRSRVSEPPYSNLWYNDYSSFSSIYTNGRRPVAATENTIANPRTSTDLRSRVAKEAAFVYAVNKQDNGIIDLNDSTNGTNPWIRDQYRAQAQDYLENLDPTVNGPDNILNMYTLAPYIDNWQHRSQELIYYCQAYDLLLGAGVAPDSVIETRIAGFASNLLNHYSAHPFIAQHFLQRNNHKLMLAGALGTVAVTLNQNENATDWINAAMVIIEWVLFADPAEAEDGFRQIDADGGYGEGPVYLRYAWSRLIPFFVAMRNFNGDWLETYSNDSLGDFYPDDASLIDIQLRSPWFDQRYQLIYDWIGKIRLPEGRLPAIEDSPLNIYFPELAILSSEYSWTFDSYTSAITKEYILFQYLGSLRADYICAGNGTEVTSPAEWGQIQYLPEAGSIVMRSDWSTEAIYLHLIGKQGITRQAAAAHDQADLNHFMIGYKGKLLVFDAGYGGWDDRYTVNKPENHNTILVNGFGSCPPSGPTMAVDSSIVIYSVGDASPVDGYFRNQYDDGYFSYIELESSYGQAYDRYPDFETMPGQEVWLMDENDDTAVDFTRSISFVDQSYFIMTDRVDNQNADSLQYTWLLHVNGGGDTEGSFQALPNGGIVNREDANLLIYVTALGSLDSLLVDSSQHADGYGLSNLASHSMLKAVKKGIDTHYLSVFFPFEDSMPEIYSLSSNGFNCLLVDRTELSYNRYELILTQLNNSTINIASQLINGLPVPSIMTQANFLVISLDSSTTGLDSVQVFGTGGDSVVINGVSYNLPELRLDQTTILSDGFALHLNYPNPFNPVTTIRYNLPMDSHVKLTIYNILGQQVIVLVDDYQNAGYKSTRWDGRTASGKLVSAGMYFYAVEAGKYSAIRKMVLLK